MYCSQCGNSVKSDANFCQHCGAIINKKQEKSTSLEPDFNKPYPEQDPLYHSNNNQPKEQNNGKISIIIGAITLILVFILQIFTIPLSIVGLVFGVKYYQQTKKIGIGLILNIISLILALPIFYTPRFFNSVNPVMGTWNCGSLENSTQYVITLKLNKDKTFIWNKYGDEKNNYVKGTFKATDLKKTNHSSQFSYYSVSLDGEEFVQNGILQTEEYKSQYQMGISTEGSKQAVLMNLTTYNTYYCHLQK